jgi:nucleotide-binding universal stress UspA family protein
MITKIVLAYDGSESADKACSFALDLASKYSAELFVVSVARPPEPADDVETEAILENAQNHYGKLFEVIKKKAGKDGINARFEVVVGHPAEQIVRFAEKQQSELIVMGHRGKTLFKRWLLGSVAKRVLSYAHCPVLVIR